MVVSMYLTEKIPENTTMSLFSLKQDLQQNFIWWTLSDVNSTGSEGVTDMGQQARIGS